MSTCWMSTSQAKAFNRICVVHPVCIKDKELLLDNLEWQNELDGIKDFECLIAADQVIPAEWIERLRLAAERAFASVEVFVCPSPPVQQWPEAPNWMFQHTARLMEAKNKSWFWMEPDCVPLCPGWLDVLNDEYWSCGKPIMGTIVEGMGHCNGTAIYPHNFPKLSHAAMSCTNLAWDGVMRKETGSKTYNANRIMCHVWGIIGGIAQPFGGDPPEFKSWKDVEKWVDLRAVVYHRSKNNSLIHQLRNKLNEHLHLLRSSQPD